MKCKIPILEAMNKITMLTEENQKLRSNLNERMPADAERVDEECKCDKPSLISSTAGSTGKQCTLCAGWRKSS